MEPKDFKSQNVDSTRATTVTQAVYQQSSATSTFSISTIKDKFKRSKTLFVRKKVKKESDDFLSKRPRLVKLNCGKVGTSHDHFPTNYISTTKYTVFNFLPFALFN